MLHKELYLILCYFAQNTQRQPSRNKHPAPPADHSQRTPPAQPRRQRPADTQRGAPPPAPAPRRASPAAPTPPPTASDGTPPAAAIVCAQHSQRMGSENRQHLPGERRRGERNKEQVKVSCCSALKVILYRTLHPAEAPADHRRRSLSAVNLP